MDKPTKRFLKLECAPILKIFSKQKDACERFACLEIEGHAIEVAIAKAPKSEYFDCPACGKRSKNRDASYCYYCGYMSDDAKQQSAATGLKPWQIRCACGNICNRNQERCLTCGAPIVVPGADAAPDEQAAKEFRTTRPIAVTIDGHLYCSTDKGLPENVKALMLKIDKEGYSKELVDEWVRKTKGEIESDLVVSRARQQQELQERAKGYFIGTIFVIFAILYIIFLSMPRR